MLSVTSTNTVGNSKPLWRFGSIPLTIVSQTKPEWGLTKQAISAIVSSIVVLFGFLIFFLFLSLFENSRINLSSKSFWADINFGKDSILLSNNINYNKSTCSIYLAI